MPGFDNKTLYADNVDFSGDSFVSPRVTSNGQLLIGSSTTPNIRVGTLQQGPGILISNGPGTITIGLSGGGQGIDSVTNDSGTNPVVPDSSGNINLLGSGSLTTVASANTTTFQLTGLTNHTVLVGAGTSTITKVGPGSAGQVLQSGGASADPAYSTATYPSTATSAGTILRATGTNWDASTATYPNTGGTAGTILRSDGTNWVNSTATYPNTGGTSGTLLTSNGTNWVNTTATYPGTAGTSGTLLTSNGTNIVNTTATYPSTASSTGTILRANGTNWVATTAAYPDTAGASGNILVSNGTNFVSSAVTAGTTIQKASITLTNAQIKALHTTPVTVVAAPGAGSANIALYMIQKLNYGGNNPFTGGGGTIALKYTTAGATMMSGMAIAKYTGTANAYQTNTPVSDAPTVSENTPLIFFTTFAITGNAANDNTISCDVYYVTVSI